jgi:hypothetical protein
MQSIISSLAANRQTFAALLSDISQEERNWRPAEDKWNLIQMVCHLRDEEVEDFRTRVKTTLESPETDPPGIDPVAWVTDRGYASQDFDAVVQSFLQERSNSISYLHQLDNPNWENGYDHQSLGRLTAKKFLANWLAHDYLHIRQIIRLRHQYLAEISGDDLGYAGGW